MLATNADRTWHRGVRSIGRYAAPTARAAALMLDRQRRTRPRARTRNRRGPAARCGLWPRSQTPARMQRHDAARKALPIDPREACRTDHLGKGIGLWKFTDRFHKVLIGFGVAGHGAAERWNQLERKQLVNPIEAGHIDGGKFQAQKFAARLEHAKRFAQRQIDPWHVADAECDGVGVEAAIGECQRLGIALDERYPVVEMPRCRALAADTQHIGVDVA